MKTSTEASFDFPCPHCQKVTKLTMRAGGPLPREMVADVVTVSPDFSMSVGTVAELPPEYVNDGGRIMHESQIAAAAQPQRCDTCDSPLELVCRNPSCSESVT